MKFLSNAAKAITMLVIAVLLTQCVPKSVYYEQKLKHIELLNEIQAIYMKNLLDEHIRHLRTLANIMSYYERIPAADRRGFYESMIGSSMSSEYQNSMGSIAALFTIWKPNAIDGMDSRFAGRPGSTASGQCAMYFAVNNTHVIGLAFSEDVDAAMDFLLGPDSKKDRVENPVLGISAGKEIYLLKMMVPIINPKTNETVGIVGCYIDFYKIQEAVEKIIMEYYEIAIMAVYSNNGMITGHLIPERTGKMLKDVDTIYGAYIQDANDAVVKGHNFYCSTYSPVLDMNVEVFITPFNIGNSDTTWSVMTAVPETFFRARGRFF